MPINPNSQAFPIVAGMHIESGLSIRAYFAAMAMQGFLAAPFDDGFDVDAKKLKYEDFIPALANWSVKYADALIAELNKGEKP